MPKLAKRELFCYHSLNGHVQGSSATLCCNDEDSIVDSSDSPQRSGNSLNVPKMASLVIERAKLMPLLMALSIFLGVTLPYIFTIVKDKLRIFLPYISHAAAFPPQSAFISIFTAIGTFFAVPTFFLRFAAIDQKRNRLEPRKIRILNIVAVVIGCLAVLTLLLSSHYPVGYVTHEKKDWMLSVVVPHFSCTALLVTLFTVYTLIQAYLTYVQRKRTTKNVFIHATLAMCVVVTNWTCILSNRRIF
ncbi:hypothetical protein AVEN_20995-1 [Araneus ventricosus]|uniref:CWH43-like N-terminal domain-containing protein n=1 Tax=Araneus ventricosus TaxID=182803 RepID=A0A4Y2D648_ARAVE|nr:hypothetical protein AVEN_20995-1 [Araneus ventricosus]